METGKTERKHIYYFDYLRIFALVSVIFMHAASAPLRAGVGGTDWQLTNAFTSLAFTAVPLFLMMSGYLSLTSEKTADYMFVLKRRLPRLVCTLAAWTAAAALWLAISEGGGIRCFSSYLLSGFSGPIMVHFWYMYTLIALTVISPFLYLGLANMGETGKKVTAALVVLVLLQTTVTILLPDKLKAYLVIDLFDALKLFGGSLSAYLLGYFLGTMKKRIPNWALILTAAADLCLIAAATAAKSAAKGKYDAALQAQNGGFVILLAACIFLLFRQNWDADCAFRRTASPLVELSLGVYLIHNILVSMAGEFGFSGMSFGYTCAKTAAVLALSYLTVKTLSSVKPLCWVFTGIKYADAKKSCAWGHAVRARRTE